MSNHTKGQWMINPYPGINGYDTTIGAMGNPIVATVTLRHASINEHRANVHLIKAAPNLLEALETLLNTESHLDDGDPVLEAARTKARLALSFAKGETNEH